MFSTRKCGRFVPAASIDAPCFICKDLDMTITTVQKLKKEIKQELIKEFILPVLRQAMPTYYLKGGEAKKIDKLVSEGLKEYRKGKTRIIKSLADLE